mmetsp:Transcript_20549/g.20827  ORF Transcript_20549/g.20827 Transcript_20549/m.20827 type:complete len:86 (+) Transcript_20549:561-818(+)
MRTSITKRQQSVTPKHDLRGDVREQFRYPAYFEGIQSLLEELDVVIIWWNTFTCFGRSSTFGNFTGVTRDVIFAKFLFHGAHLVI